MSKKLPVQLPSLLESSKAQFLYIIMGCSWCATRLRANRLSMGSQTVLGFKSRQSNRLGVHAPFWLHVQMGWEVGCSTLRYCSHNPLALAIPFKIHCSLHALCQICGQQNKGRAPKPIEPCAFLLTWSAKDDIILTGWCASKVADGNHIEI